MRNRHPSRVRACHLLAGASLIALTALGAAPAWAQSQDSQPAASDEDSQIETIVVTATKREQTLQDVPVAVSVTTAQAVERANVRDLIDLQSIVPTLRVGQLQSSANTNFIIRGFGNGANNAGIESSVGVFIDGVYRSRSASAISDLPNLQRIEVLRGPQSTLFGKNASAGVISIVTRQPQFEWFGNGEISFGNYNALVVKGDVTGPISDTVAFSLAAGMNTREGYARDANLGIDTNERDRWYARGQLRWQPNDDLNFRLIVDHDEINEICCVAANVFDGPTGNVVRLLGGRLDSNNPFSYRVFYNFPSTNEIVNSGVSLQADWTFGNFQLTSITASRRSDAATNQDSDFTSADLIGSNTGDTRIKTFTQELRLASDFDGPFNFLLGAYWFDEEIEVDNALTFGANFRGYTNALSGNAIGLVESIVGVPAGTFHRPGQGIFDDMSLDNQAWSVFGTVDWQINDAFTFTLGFNQTEDEKAARVNVVTTDTFSTLDFVAIGNGVIRNTGIAQGVGTALGLGRNATAAEIGAFSVAQPAIFAQITAGATAFANANHLNPAVNPLLGLRTLQFLPPFLNYPNAVENGLTSDGKFTYAARLAWDINDSLNAYVSYSTGFKASSVNLSRDSRPLASDFIPGSPVTNPPTSRIRAAGLAVPNLTTGTRSAGPEESAVIELGLKARFDTFAFNIAIFDQEIQGFQSNAFTGTGFSLVNAGKQSTKGVEFDSNWNPIDPLTLSAAFTWLDPLYDSFVGGLRNGQVADLSGTRPAGIPEWSWRFGANHVHDFANDARLITSVDYAYESKVELSENIPGYFRTVRALGASVTYVLPTGLEASLWGRNLTDEQYLTTIFPGVAQSGTVSGYPSQPRTWGITLRNRW